MHLPHPRHPRSGASVAAVGALLAACAGALAACAGATGPGASVPPSTSPALSPPSAAALRAVDAAVGVTVTRTAEVQLELSPSQVFGPAQAPVLGSGTFDFATTRGRAQLHQPAGTETVVFLPASVFVRQPTGPNILPKGKSWVSAGLTETALTTNFPQFVIQVEALNPVFLLRQVAWGAVAAAPLSGTSVGGAPADGYLVTVDLARAQSAATGAGDAAFARATAFQLGALGPGSAPSAAAPTTDQVRLWVDRASGRVVRYQASPPGAGVGTVSATLNAFVAPERVVAPARAVVADIASLSPGGERENNGGGDSDGA